MATVANYLGNAAWVIEQLYDSYDLNKNGHLTKEEFTPALNKLGVYNQWTGIVDWTRLD